jgi:hypothetical protein
MGASRPAEPSRAGTSAVIRAFQARSVAVCSLQPAAKYLRFVILERSFHVASRADMLVKDEFLPSDANARDLLALDGLANVG